MRDVVVSLSAYKADPKGENRAMTAELPELHRAQRGVAILATCIVETLNDSDPEFKQRFLKNLDHAYRELKDNSEGDVVQEMTLLSWTSQYLTGWDMIKGQGKPFLSNR